MNNHNNHSLRYINLLMADKDAADLGANLTSQHRRNCKYYVEIIKRLSSEPPIFSATSYNSIRKLAILLNESDENLGRHILKKSTSYINAATRLATIKEFVGKDGFHSNTLSTKTPIKDTSHIKQCLLSMLRMMAYADVRSLKELKPLIAEKDYERLYTHHNALGCVGDYIDVAITFTCTLLMESSDISTELRNIKDEYEVEPSFARAYLLPIVSESIAELISGMEPHAVN